MNVPKEVPTPGASMKPPEPFAATPHRLRLSVCETVSADAACVRCLFPKTTLMSVETGSIHQLHQSPTRH
ncbi:hypothetical protein BU24DRAFT_422709, partial [Aaosphaeria arxii CBS 175.79]